MQHPNKERRVKNVLSTKSIEYTEEYVAILFLNLQSAASYILLLTFFYHIWWCLRLVIHNSQHAQGRRFKVSVLLWYSRSVVCFSPQLKKVKCAFFHILG